MKLTKQEKSWILYDCGNSAYSMAITTALFPIYFSIIKGGSLLDYGFFISIASLIVAIISPILGTIADYKDTKKRFFIFFVTVGIVFTAALALVPTSMWGLLIVFYIITSVGFSSANIFYDAFLVDVSSNDRMDKVSSSGFAYGYISSVIPFAISLGIVYFIGMDKMLGYQLGFVITALWWGLFTLPLIKNVKQEYYIEKEPNPIRMSFKRLSKTFLSIKKHKVILLFLFAYFLYIDGVGTIIKMCVPYAKTVIGADAFSDVAMLGILLVIQLIAFPCALLYGTLAKKYSAKFMLIIGLITYILATVFAFRINNLVDVFILGGMIGSAQGGVQALSRSYYAKIIPKKQSNEFFGFYNVFGKFAAIIGPVLMPLVTYMSGDARYSILAIIPLFVFGLLLLLFLPSDSKLQINKI